MSSPWESEMHRTAWVKAQEGNRLLGARDYWGAITACTEAIELNPGSIGARRTRAEAFNRLGKEGEAALGAILDSEAMASQPGCRLFFGTVTHQWMDYNPYDDLSGPPPTKYSIQVSHVQMHVSKEQYFSINVGETVTFLESGHRGVFVRCGTPSARAQPLPPPEPDPKEIERFQRLSDQLDEQWREQRRGARNKDCAALQKLGIDARVLDRDPLTPRATEIEDGTKPDGWIEIAGGPIRWVEPGRGLCHVPDSRIGPDFEFPYTEVYSERRKRFPVFGRVESVRWYDGSGGAAGPKDAYFSGLVAGFLSQNTAATEALMMAGIDLCVFLEPYRGTWIVHETGWYRWTRSLWDCCQAISDALLAMPIPTDE